MARAGRTGPIVSAERGTRMPVNPILVIVVVVVIAGIVYLANRR